MDHSSRYHDELDQDSRDWLIDQPCELPTQPIEFCSAYSLSPNH